MSGDAATTSNDLSGASYVNSFGGMPDRMTYLDPLAEYDTRSEIKSMLQPYLKAMTTQAGGAGTAGYAMVPVAVDQLLIDQSIKFTPWTELVKRVTNIGMYAVFNFLSSKGSAVTTTEDPVLTDVSDTEDQSATPIRFLESVGRVTAPMRASMPAYSVYPNNPSGVGVGGNFGTGNVSGSMQYQIRNRMQALKEKEDDLIWNGSNSTTATEYDGLVTLQSTTNKVDLNTTALEWDNVEEASQFSFDDSGNITIGGCGSAVARDLRGIMVDTLRISPGQLGGSIGFGIPAPLTLETMTGSIPIVPSQRLTNASGSKGLYFLDTNVIEMRVLQDATYEELANTNGSKKFHIAMFETILNKSPAFSSFVGEIL